MEPLDLNLNYPDSYFSVIGDLFSIILFPREEVENPTPNPDSSLFEDGNEEIERILGTYNCWYKTIPGDIGDNPFFFIVRI